MFLLILGECKINNPKGLKLETSIKNKLAAISKKRDELNAVSELYRSLGGGWR